MGVWNPNWKQGWLCDSLKPMTLRVFGYRYKFRMRNRVIRIYLNQTVTLSARGSKDSTQIVSAWIAEFFQNLYFLTRAVK